MLFFISIHDEPATYPTDIGNTKEEELNSLLLRTNRTLIFFRGFSLNCILFVIVNKIQTLIILSYTLAPQKSAYF